MSHPPIVTAEELASLLALAPTGERTALADADRTETWLAQGGGALWLTKGLFLYLALQTWGLHTLPTHYLWMRCTLEVLCCAVFWSTLRQPARRAVTLGALLVGATTLCMDGLMLLMLPA